MKKLLAIVVTLMMCLSAMSLALAEASPAYTETVNEFKEFKDEAEFRAWVEREESRKYGREKYRPIAFKAVDVKTTLSFNIKS